MYQGHKDLKVYQLAYESQMEVFKLTLKFPDDEKYSLTKQIRNSSRSVAANIAEGYRKRNYPDHFKSTMTLCDGEATETYHWLDVATDCGYITSEEKDSLQKKYAEIGRMLASMIKHPEKFRPFKPKE